MKHYYKSERRLRRGAVFLGLTLIGSVLLAGAAVAGHSSPGPTFPQVCPPPGQSTHGYPAPLDPFCDLDLLVN
jgi:hypothetical protein